MVIDNERNIIATKNRIIFLSPIENIILSIAIENKNKVVFYDTFLKALKPYGVDKPTLIQHIYVLNQKLNNELWLICKPTIGYYIEQI